MTRDQLIGLYLICAAIVVLIATVLIGWLVVP
jgi:hypothetical protein